MYLLAAATEALHFWALMFMMSLISYSMAQSLENGGAPQITNSAVHAKWAVVFAQLHLGGKNEGIHGFLVRIRNEVVSTWANAWLSLHGNVSTVLPGTEALVVECFLSALPSGWRRVHCVQPASGGAELSSYACRTCR